MSAKERKRKSAIERKRAQTSGKERLCVKIWKPPGLNQAGLGTPNELSLTVFILSIDKRGFGPFGPPPSSPSSGTFSTPQVSLLWFSGTEIHD